MCSREGIANSCRQSGSMFARLRLARRSGSRFGSSIFQRRKAGSLRRMSSRAFLDAFTGQHVSQDGPLPYADITDPQTLNKYAYVRNNPLRYTDPDGHCAETLTCTFELGTAGAEIGSALGPVGTVVGGLIGAGVGAFVGYEIGKAIVNRLSGSQLSSKLVRFRVQRPLLETSMLIQDPIPLLILFGLILLTVWLWRWFKDR